LGEGSRRRQPQVPVRAGEILFGKIRPYFHKVGIPPVTGICSTDAIVIHPREGHWAGLVLAVMSSDPFVQHAVQTSQGTKMPRANWAVLEHYRVAVSGDELLTRFHEQMSDTVSLIHALVMANRNLRTTRDLLLPRLISGEIEVSELDLDGVVDSV
jgi:type I restriction enzyme S subunit